MSDKNNDLSVEQNALELIQINNAISQHAIKMASERKAMDDAVQARIPEVVNALVTHGRITEDLRKKASDMLRNHMTTLEILANTAAHRSDVELQHLGEQVDTTNGHSKRAAKGDLNSPYCGTRSTEKRASDLDFEMRVLGRPVNN